MEVAGWRESFLEASFSSSFTFQFLYPTLLDVLPCGTGEVFTRMSSL